jgi:hypothetical protein
MRKLVLIAATAVGTFVLAASPMSIKWSPEGAVSVSTDQAFAVIGRPLTPGSVAGVNRRVHRRAYRRGY